MIYPPIPENETKRLAAVLELGILDTAPEKRFDRITTIATKLFEVPISTVTIMDADREWYKSCQGLDAKENPRVISFCGHAITSKEEIMIVEDTKKDPRFSDNPMVIGSPFIRFYAGVPIYSLTDEIIGVFCIKDIKPKSLSESDQYLLRTLASWAELEVNIVSLKNGLRENSNSDKLRPILNRLVNRNVIETLKSIQFGLKNKFKDQKISEITESEEAIEETIKLIVKIEQSIVPAF